MSMYDKNHYNIVISLQLIKINGKKKKENTKTEILKSQPKRHCSFVEWMWDEPKSELRLETDSSPMTVHFPWWTAFQAAVGDDTTETSLLGLLSLLHLVSCWAFLSAFSISRPIPE